MDWENEKRVLEQKLERKTQLLEHEKKLTLELRAQVNDMVRSFKTNPSDKWYLRYLMQQLAAHERLHQNHLDVIDQYQKHFSKYGHFYQELEEKRNQKEHD